MNTKPNLWQWSPYGSGWCQEFSPQDGNAYRAAGVFCGVWDLHGRVWHAEVVARKITEHKYRWKWQCRPSDDACVRDNHGDEIQIVMLRDSAYIDCFGTRWSTWQPIAPEKALINCQAILMAMGFANKPPQNPIPLVSPRDLLQLQGLRP